MSDTEACQVKEQIFDCQVRQITSSLVPSLVELLPCVRQLPSLVG